MSDSYFSLENEMYTGSKNISSQIAKTTNDIEILINRGLNYSDIEKFSKNSIKAIKQFSNQVNRDILILFFLFLFQLYVLLY